MMWLSQDGEIKILWLYHDLLDLYGDHGNLILIQNRLRQMNISVQIVKKSLADVICFQNFDMIYIGSGKTKNLQQAAKHLIRFKEQVREAVSEGKVFLITGNARLLFGKGFFDAEGHYTEALRLFSYTGREVASIMTSDVIGFLHPSKESEARRSDLAETLCFGFINRTSYVTGNTGPFLFQITKGICRGEPEYEGTYFHHFYGTWLLGPVLVKNPDFAEEILRVLAKERFRPYEDNLEREALEQTLKHCLHSGLKQILTDLKKRFQWSAHR